MLNPFASESLQKYEPHSGLRFYHKYINVYIVLSLDDNTILSPTNDNEINIDNIDFGFENIEIS